MNRLSAVIALNCLISRLRQCRPGETYPLDVVERELLLNEIDRLRLKG